MADKPWDQQVVSFLKRTGEDLKKAGEDIRVEAQKLIADIRDPETQQKIRDNLANLGTWAKQTAEGAAGAIDQAVKKAEDAWKGRTAAAPKPKAKSKAKAAGKAKAKVKGKGPAKRKSGKRA
jgi:peptidoglycan hydrolase CwlO-like protein